VTDAKVPGRLKRFVIRWEMVFYAVTVAQTLTAIVLVVLLFPDVSNLWVSIFVLTSGFTAAVASAISAIKSR
jgi:hypothetical protein